MDNFSNKEIMQDTNQDDHKNFDEQWLYHFICELTFLV
jgi:hypothetical protein